MLKQIVYDAFECAPFAFISGALVLYTFACGRAFQGQLPWIFLHGSMTWIIFAVLRDMGDEGRGYLFTTLFFVPTLIAWAVALLTASLAVSLIELVIEGVLNWTKADRYVPNLILSQLLRNPHAAHKKN